MNTNAPAMPANDGAEWFGHPKGLFYLFFAEMWERFCFYGMRNVLVLYMVSYFKFSDTYAQGSVYAAYTALIYCVAVPGGFIADRFLGYSKSIMFGGVIMALGMIVLLFNTELLGYVGIPVSSELEQFFFYAGLATVIVGNGYFKPNISTIVGKLYPAGDPRRDSGFTIFYMGINVGAFAGGIICGILGEKVSWPLGFGLAAAGMLLGVFTFGTNKAQATLKGFGDPPSAERAKKSMPMFVLGSLAMIPVFYYLLKNGHIVGWILAALGVFAIGWLLSVAFKEGKVQREKIFALCVLVLFNPIFWAFFEQAGSSLTLFANRNVNLDVFGWKMPASWPQQANAIFIVLLAPVFAGLWIWLAKRDKNPSIPFKFVLGLFQLGLGFLVLVLGAKAFASEGITPLIFLFALYLLLTMGELCLSPVGLSMVTKLAPERMTGAAMGIWFLSVAAANFLAGQIAAITDPNHGKAADEVATDLPATETLPVYLNVFENSAYIIFAATFVLLCLVPLLKKWMHDVK